MPLDLEKLRKLNLSQVMVTARIGPQGDLIRIEC